MAKRPKPKKADELQPIESEVQDSLASPPSYEILTYPADFTLEVLNDKLVRGDIVVPKFQRRFVWSPSQASKLIESFLLGLPVPPVFLYAGTKGETIVVDGQQRLRTIQFYFSGLLGDEDQDDRPVFRLVNLHPRSPFANKTYQDLEETDPASFRRLNDAVLRSFVVKQLNPNDDTSIYHIFERLNTGGTFLQGQEIRNCVYDGTFSRMLNTLNKNALWRELFGKKARDKRQRDVELILRFFAMLEKFDTYEKPMKEFLNKYMATNRQIPRARVQEMSETFTNVVKRVHACLGKKPFHIKAGLNAAVYDSIFLAFGQHSGTPSKGRERFNKLLKDADYIENVSTGTTDKGVITRRLEIAKKAMFGR